MTPELHALARDTAHRHTARCTGGQATVTMGRLSPYERHHSATCDSLTAAIIEAMERAIASHPPVSSTAHDKGDKPNG